MANVKEHSGQLDECKSIFVTWTYMIGIIFTLAGVTIALGAMYWPLESKQDNMLTDHEKRIVKMEGVQQDLDTIKTILRAR